MTAENRITTIFLMRTCGATSLHAGKYMIETKSRK